MTNLEYEQDTQMLLSLYDSCYFPNGKQKLTTAKQRVSLLESVQSFARKACIADSQTYFGSKDRAYLNDDEINRVVRMIRV